MVHWFKIYDPLCNPFILNVGCEEKKGDDFAPQRRLHLAYYY